MLLIDSTRYLGPAGKLSTQGVFLTFKQGHICSKKGLQHSIVNRMVQQKNTQNATSLLITTFTLIHLQ